MAAHDFTPRKRAERTVQDRYDREQAKLTKDYMSYRRDLVRRYRHDLQNNEAAHRNVGEQRKEALSRHERLWEYERQRLANRTSRAPGFTLFGPPQRNLQREYNERRERWEAQREAIKERFDLQAEQLAGQRRDLRDDHQNNLHNCELRERRAHDQMNRRHQRSFESDLRQELSQRDRAVGPTFERHARDPGRER